MPREDELPTNTATLHDKSEPGEVSEAVACVDENRGQASRNSMKHTLLVATVLCVVCSVFVSGAAVGLQGRQEDNKKLDQQKNILIAAGLFQVEDIDNETEKKPRNTNADVAGLFASVQTELIDLETGEPVDDKQVNPATYQPRVAAKDPKESVLIPADKDLAGIGRREKYAFVYVIQDGKKVEQVVLPVYGKGLWSTLYGYLALDSDGNTVRGITFYEHAETPGLGGEVDNPTWKSLWGGKEIFDAQGEVVLEVTKGVAASSGPQANHQIDGLSGATITCRGVSNLVRYWMGEDGFGPYLKRLRKNNPTQPESSDLTQTLGQKGGEHG